MNIRIALAGVVTAGAIILPAAAAHAVPGASSSPPIETNLPISNGFVTAPAVQGAGGVRVVPTAAVQTGGSLPFTGGDVGGLSVIGAGLLGAGLVLVRRNRKAEKAQ